MENGLDLIEKLNITYVEEKAPKKLSHKHKYVALLLVQGISQKRACQITGYTPLRMHVLSNCQIMVEEISKLRAGLFDKMTSNQNFERMGRVAEKELEEILINREIKTHTKLRAIELALDRKFGKPRQEIIHEGSALREILEELHEKKKKVIELDSEEIVDAEIIEKDSEKLPAPDSIYEDKSKPEDESTDDPTDNYARWLKENMGQ